MDPPPHTLPHPKLHLAFELEISHAVELMTKLRDTFQCPQDPRIFKASGNGRPLASFQHPIESYLDSQSLLCSFHYAKNET